MRNFRTAEAAASERLMYKFERDNWGTWLTKDPAAVDGVLDEFPGVPAVPFRFGVADSTILVEQ